jgi:ABC-2 type transport system permease protein
VSSLVRMASVAWKETRQLLRDRITFGLIVGIPALQIVLFGYAINFDVRDLQAVVLDQARTSLSRQIVADLAATQVMRIAWQADSEEEFREIMARGEAAIGVVIQPDVERRIAEGGRSAVQIVVDGSQPSLENIAQGLAGLPLASRPGEAGTRDGAVALRVEYNPEKRTAVQIVPALVGTILNITMVIFTAGAIVRERERGNLELLITTPVSRGELMLGKLLPYIAIGLIQTTLILLLGHTLFDVPIVGSLVELYAGAALFIAATLALGLFISTIARTQFQAFQMAFMTMLPAILMSGFVFPFDGMPQAAQWIAQVLPLTHFVEIVRGIVLRGAHLTDMHAQLAKLGAFFVVMMTAATLRFHKRLD